VSLLNYHSQVYYAARKRLRLPDIIAATLALILALLSNKGSGFRALEKYRATLPPDSA
jgi:hypothetical protein